MQVVLAGASGLIGSALKAELRTAGHDVLVLVRRPTSKSGEDTWDPANDRLDPQFLADADAVACLSGVGVGDHRWTEAYKREIVGSRVDSVGTIARSLAQYGGPRIFLSASAVGYYGDTGPRTVDEQAPPGDTFLASVCTKWEAAARPAQDAGVRVALLRTGLVISRGGGLLKRLVPIVKAGIGGKLGDGRQYAPWISLADEARAIRFLLEHEVAGPVNLSAPTPVTNAELTASLGAVLRRPTVFPVPGFAARIALGEFAAEVLIGQRAVPRRLLDAGFEFTNTDLRAALEAELS